MRDFLATYLPAFVTDTLDCEGMEGPEYSALSIASDAWHAGRGEPNHFERVVAEMHGADAAATLFNRDPLAHDTLSTRDEAAQIKAPARGEFHATVSGDVSASIRGVAVFGVQPNEKGEHILAIVLKGHVAGDTQEESVTLSNRLSEAPAVGRYGLGDMGESTFVGLYSRTMADLRIGVYSATRGVLQVLDSGPVHVHGAFEFAGDGQNNFDLWAVEGEVRVFGEFNAARIADPISFAFSK